MCLDIKSAAQEAWRYGIRDHIQDAETTSKDLSESYFGNYYYIEEWEVGVPLEDTDGSCGSRHIATYHFDNGRLISLYKDPISTRPRSQPSAARYADVQCPSRMTVRRSTTVIGA